MHLESVAVTWGHSGESNGLDGSSCMSVCFFLHLLVADCRAHDQVALEAAKAGTLWICIGAGGHAVRMDVDSTTVVHRAQGFSPELTEKQSQWSTKFICMTYSSCSESHMLLNNEAGRNMDGTHGTACGAQS